jgi:hypothetical protein
MSAMSPPHGDTTASTSSCHGVVAQEKSLIGTYATTVRPHPKVADGVWCWAGCQMIVAYVTDFKGFIDSLGSAAGVIGAGVVVLSFIHYMTCQVWCFAAPYAQLLYATPSHPSGWCILLKKESCLSPVSTCRCGTSARRRPMRRRRA